MQNPKDFMKFLLHPSCVCMVKDPNRATFPHVVMSSLVRELPSTSKWDNFGLIENNNNATNFSWEELGVCHTVVLPFILKSISRQKKNYGYSNISPCKNIIFQNTCTRNQNPSRYYNSIMNLKFQQSSQNIIFQKYSYKNRPIIIT